jgi:hypothetical protein
MLGNESVDTKIWGGIPQLSYGNCLICGKRKRIQLMFRDGIHEVV